MKNQPHFESPESQPDEKKKIWDEKMSQMLMPDVYGYILDKKIRETIVALNLLGINTTQSDQGNYSDSPWIEFQAPVPENYYIGESDLKNKVLEQRKLSSEVMDKSSPLFDRSLQVNVWADSRDELMKSGAEYTPEFLKYLEDTQNMTEKMQGLIDEYYASATDIQEEGMRVEIIYPYADPKHSSYLHQVPFLKVSVPEHGKSEEDREAIVAQTQAEMLRFTEFLKKKFFEDKL